jgi:hypothetical protein
VLNLFSAISAGDVSGAQSAYASLTSLLGSSDSATTNATSNAVDSSTSGSSFDNLLSQSGSALGSGDITAAQSALDGFLQSLSAGSIVNAAA